MDTACYILREFGLGTLALVFIAHALVLTAIIFAVASGRLSIRIATIVFVATAIAWAVSDFLIGNQ